MLNRRSKLILLAVMWSGVASADIARVEPVGFLAIGSALKTFRIQAGRYPTEAEGLMALVEKPATYPADRRWQQVMKKLPVDPWGNPVHYIASQSLDGEFGLYSTGADGVSHSGGNDPDDWNSWSEDGRGRTTFMAIVREFPWFLWLALVAFAVAALAIIRSTRSHGAKTKC
jgi:type II secretion system protein G